VIVAGRENDRTRQASSSSIAAGAGTAGRRSQGAPRGDRVVAEYLVLAQDRAHAEQWLRRRDGWWLFTEVGSLEAVLQLPSIDCELRLADAYHRVLAS